MPPSPNDGHDKPICTKAIIDNLNKALGDTDNCEVSIF